MFLLNFNKLEPQQKQFIRRASYDDAISLMLLNEVKVNEFNDTLKLNEKLAKSLRILQGVVGVSKIDNDFITVFNIGFVDLPSTSLDPHKVKGTYVKDGKIYTDDFIVNESIVLWRYNAFCHSEFNIDRYATTFSEVDLSLEYLLKKSRLNPLLQVEDSKEKELYERAMKATDDGVMHVFINKKKHDPMSKDIDKLPLLDLNDVSNTQMIQYLSDYYLTLWQRIANLHGMSFANSTKHAQQTTDEVNGLDGFSWLLPMENLEQTKQFCEDMKAVYDIDLTCNFGTIHELKFKQYTNDCTTNDDIDNDICEDIEKGDEENADNQDAIS